MKTAEEITLEIAKKQAEINALINENTSAFGKLVNGFKISKLKTEIEALQWALTPKNSRFKETIEIHYSGLKIENSVRQEIFDFISKKIGHQHISVISGGSQKLD